MATPNMNLTLPTEDGDIGVWDGILNDALDLVDAHDHTSGKGVRIPMATGVTVGADVPWNSGGNYYAITGIKALDFQPLTAASMSTYAAALFVNSADNELYWRSTGGTNVKLTQGASINASLIGGIGGDYASVSALVDFVDGSDAYRFRQQVGGGSQQYARMQSADLDLYEFKAHPTVGVPTNRVRLASPAALGASYALTFPGAVPGSQSAVQVSAAGLLSFSNTFPNPMTFGGLATLNAGATVATGQNLTLSGTSDLKHGDRVKVFSPDLFLAGSWAANAGGYIVTSAGASPGYLKLDGFLVGDRIKSLTFMRFGDASAQLLITVSVIDGTTMVGAAIGNSGSITPAASWLPTTIDVTDTTIGADGDAVFVTLANTAANLRIGNILVTYDHP